MTVLLNQDPNGHPNQSCLIMSRLVFVPLSCFRRISVLSSWLIAGKHWGRWRDSDTPSLLTTLFSFDWSVVFSFDWSVVSFFIICCLTLHWLWRVAWACLVLCLQVLFVLSHVFWRGLSRVALSCAVLYFDVMRCAVFYCDVSCVLCCVCVCFCCVVMSCLVFSSVFLCCVGQS